MLEITKEVNRGTLRHFKCEWCRKDYERLTPEGKNSRWCSHACRKADRDKRRGDGPLLPLARVLGPHQFVKIRQRVLAKTGGICQYCEVPLVFTTFRVEHATPLSRGGTHDFDNLVPACASCNAKKKSRLAEEFLATMPWRYQPN